MKSVSVGGVIRELVKMRTHRQLCLLNLIGVGCGLCSSACFGLVWYYWRRTLNTCEDIGSCGCVLYGTWGFTEFSGGHSSNCSFVTFAPLPMILWSLLMASYHGFMNNVTKESRRILITSNPTLRKKEINPQILPKLFAVCSSIVAIASAIIAFAAGIVLTDGYFKTCKEYKKSVVDQLGANGELAKLVTDRLSCATVYDFLDYLQPDPEYLDIRYRRGSWMIDTDLSLKFALITTWMTFSLYTILSIFYVISSRKPRIVPNLMNTEL